MSVSPTKPPSVTKPGADAAPNAAPDAAPDAVPAVAPVRLDTHRLALSVVARADADELIRANQASAALHRPWMAPYTNLGGFLSWYALGVVGPNLNLLVREADSRALVSVISLENIVLGSCWSASLSYYGLTGATGGGRQTQAVYMGLRYGFGRVGLHRIEASIQPGNLRSRALVQRLGFTCEGMSRSLLHLDGAWRDHERWALMRDELRV